MSLHDPSHTSRIQAEAESTSALAVCEEQRGVIAELERAVADSREEAAAVAAAGAEWRRQQLSTDQVWADNARLAALLQHGPHFHTLLQGRRAPARAGPWLRLL